MFMCSVCLWRSLTCNCHACVLGYVPDVNLIACPYDWRIPPWHNEERDRFFSRLKQSIEDTVRRCREKVRRRARFWRLIRIEFTVLLLVARQVVVVCHSMGNRTFHYFLNSIVLKVRR